MMDEEEVSKIRLEASSQLLQESTRSRVVVNIPDPGSTSVSLDLLGLDVLKKKFPFLSEYSDNYIIEAGVHNLIKAEKMARQFKDMDKNSKAEDKLFNNREELEGTLHKIKEGEDNRISILHPARCLPGAACSAGKLWLHARENLADKGHPPLSSYDMQAIGLSGSVTAKGWVELHNPSSTSISIKQFTMNASLSSRGGKDSEVADMEDLSEFRAAVRALRGAMSMVHPWNHSIAALENFFLQNNFCNSDLSGTSHQVNNLVRFTDYVLAENAGRWRDRECFLTTRDLRGVWKDYLSQNKSASSKSGKQGPAQQAGGAGTFSAGNQGSSQNRRPLHSQNYQHSQ